MDKVSITEKRCSCCKVTKPARIEFFGRNKAMRYGWQSYCRECANAKKRARIAALRPPETIEDRFRRLTDRQGPMHPGLGHCWIWQGNRNRPGYGRVSVRNRVKLAHRVAWELSHGEIPDGLRVLHKCDNPPCVNPDHLFLGTDTDNSADMRAKGRQHRKLSDDDVRRIRILREQGVTLDRLGKLFGVDMTAIYAVVQWRSYKYVR